MSLPLRLRLVARLRWVQVAAVFGGNMAANSHDSGASSPLSATHSLDNSITGAGAVEGGLVTTMRREDDDDMALSAAAFNTVDLSKSVAPSVYVDLAATMKRTVQILDEPPATPAPLINTACAACSSLPSVVVIFIVPLLLGATDPTTDDHIARENAEILRALVPLMYLVITTALALIVPILGGASPRWRTRLIGALLLVTNVCLILLVVLLGLRVAVVWRSIVVVTVVGVTASQAATSIWYASLYAAAGDAKEMAAAAGDAIMAATIAASAPAALAWVIGPLAHLSTPDRARLACGLALAVSAPLSIFSWIKMRATPVDEAADVWVGLKARLITAVTTITTYPEAGRFVYARVLYQGTLRCLPALGATYLAQVAHLGPLVVSSVIFVGLSALLVGIAISHKFSSRYSRGLTPLILPCGAVAVTLAWSSMVVADGREKAEVHVVALLWGLSAGFLSGHEIYRIADFDLTSYTTQTDTDRDAEARRAVWSLYNLTDACLGWLPALYFLIVAVQIAPLPTWTLPVLAMPLGVAILLLASSSLRVAAILSALFCGSLSNRFTSTTATSTYPTHPSESGTHVRDSSTSETGRSAGDRRQFKSLSSHLSVIPESPADADGGGAGMDAHDFRGGEHAWQTMSFSIGKDALMK